MTRQPLLEVTDLVVSYATAGGREVHAVNGVSLAVHAGQITAIVGESGSGKSTTAQAIIGLLPGNADIDAGEIRLDGRDLAGLSEKQWRGIRGTRIGLIPQDPNNSLNPVKTIGESVAEGLAVHRRGTAATRKARVLELLEQVGIDDPARRYDQYPHELSGGMKQRVLIAAAVEGDYVRIDVRDTGHGIHPDDLPFIWDRFYRGRENDRVDEESTGLGLTLVKELTEAMGGNVAVESTPGQGSCFTLRLPAA